MSYVAVGTPHETLGFDPAQIGMEFVAGAREGIAFPWNTYSPATKTLQQNINAKLKEKNLCPLLKADGVLGPDTCATAREINFDIVPVTCKAFGTAPVSCEPRPSVVVATAPPPPAPIEPVFAPPPKPGLSRASMVAGGVVLAALSVGGYYIGKKKGWFK